MLRANCYIKSGLSKAKTAGFICLLLCCGLLPTRLIHAAEPMLPQVYSEQTDVSGWLMSEKLDGVRGYWDGRQLFSKNGRLLNPPDTFVSGFPDFPLEGELWGGRGRFELAASVVQRKQADADWLQLKFAVFDVPRASGPFDQRLGRARSWFAAHPSAYAFVIPQVPVRDRGHLLQELQRIESLGGEGLIVRDPAAFYVPGRNAQILKVKSYQDTEATVIAHLRGQGRNAGRLGALLVEMQDGTQFRLGTGFSDEERIEPPPVGELVTFKFYGRYASGIPRFPVFLRIRRDKRL